MDWNLQTQEANIFSKWAISAALYWRHKADWHTVEGYHHPPTASGRKEKEGLIQPSNWVLIQIPYLCPGLSYFNSVSLTFLLIDGGWGYLSHSVMLTTCTFVWQGGPVISMATPSASLPSAALEMAAPGGIPQVKIKEDTTGNSTPHTSHISKIHTNMQGNFTSKGSGQL